MGWALRLFWVAAANSTMGRFDPVAISGATGRVLLVVEDPDAVWAQAVSAGAQPASPVQEEHGWRLGRIVDPFGHEWEIGERLCPPTAPARSASSVSGRRRGHRRLKARPGTVDEPRVDGGEQAGAHPSSSGSAGAPHEPGLVG